MTIYRQPADQTHGPNCGPTSVAVLTGNPLTDVMDLIRTTAGYGTSWKGGTVNRGYFHSDEKGECFKALHALDANPVVETGLLDQHRGRQLRSVVADLPSDRAYLICTGSHAQAVVDGRVFDQSTSVEGDPAATYWGRRKKVNVIISVDRLTAKSNEEDATVTDNNTETTEFDALAAIVAKFEAKAATSVAAIKDLTGVKNTAKVSAYAHVIAGLVALKIRKGTLAAGAFRDALTAAGVSKSCAKRYCENGQKAKGLAWIKAAGGDADAILEAFEANGVRTEQDLVNIVSPKAVLTAAEELAAKAVALTDSDEAAVQALRDATAALVAALAAAATTETPLDIAA